MEESSAKRRSWLEETAWDGAFRQSWHQDPHPAYFECILLFLPWAQSSSLGVTAIGYRTLGWSDWRISELNYSRMQRLDSQRNTLAVHGQHTLQGLDCATFRRPLESLVVFEKHLFPAALHNQLSGVGWPAQFLVLVDKSLQIGQTLATAGHNPVKAFFGFQVGSLQQTLISVHRFGQACDRCCQALELILDSPKLLRCRLPSASKSTTYAMSVCDIPVFAPCIARWLAFVGDAMRSSSPRTYLPRQLTEHQDVAYRRCERHCRWQGNIGLVLSARLELKKAPVLATQH